MFQWGNLASTAGVVIASDCLLHKERDWQPFAAKSKKSGSAMLHVWHPLEQKIDAEACRPAPAMVLSNRVPAYTWKMASAFPFPEGNKHINT